MKVGELTEPMVDVISKVTVYCLDPDGTIDKTRNSAIHSLSTGGKGVYNQQIHCDLIVIF